MAAGPEVLVDDGGNHLLLKPGDFVDPMEVEVSSVISSTKKMKRVMKKSGGDVLYLTSRQLTAIQDAVVPCTAVFVWPTQHSNWGEGGLLSNK